MYLLPTGKELTEMYSRISPRQMFLRAAREAINEVTRFDEAMPYFDDIEDDIINMRRDINGNRAPWYLSDYSKGTDSVRYRGKNFEIVPAEQPNFPDGPGVEHASSWDEI